MALCGEYVPFWSQHVKLTIPLDGIKEGKGQWYKGRKPLLAEEVCPFITRETLASVLDLPERLNEICKVIRGWNRM